MRASLQRLVAGGCLEAAHEVADAHAVFPRDVFEAELVGKVLFEPVLDLQDDHVLVQLLPTKTDAGLNAIKCTTENSG